MKFLLSVLLCSIIGFTNAQILDNFKDGNIQVNPKWEGDVSKFTTDNERLRSNSSQINDRFYLSTASNYSWNCQWELLVVLQFSTSSKNLIELIVISDSSNLKNFENGYSIQIGGSKDKLSLLKWERGASAVLLSSKDGSIKGGSSKTRVKLVRDKDSMFSLFVDFNGGTNYELIGSIKDTDIAISSYSGIIIEQSTSSFFFNHFFDDFYAGPIFQDTIPPIVSNFQQLDLFELQLSFNEALDSLSAINPMNYFVDNQIGNPLNVRLINGSKVELLFARQLENPKNYQIRIQNVKDNKGNISDTNIHFLSLIPMEPKVHEVIITELLPIPDPPVSLPSAEFLELYNRSNKPINLSELNIEDISGSKGIASGFMYSKEYVILCNKEDSLAFSVFGKVIPINGMPSLNNTGDRIRITNNAGDVIHEVEYNNSVFPAEKESGWSLEMIDIDNPCHFNGNWDVTASIMGGTPGRVNSRNNYNEDRSRPFLQSVYPISQSKIALEYNESVLSNTMMHEANFLVLENGETPDSILKTGSLNKFVLCFSNPFVLGKKYSIQYAGGKDCVGNTVEMDTILFGIPMEVNKGSLLINEILYEPFVGNAEFVEIFNNTDNFLDLKDLKIGKRVDGKLEDVSFASSTGRLIAPKSYLVLSSDVSSVSASYFTKDSLTFYETEALPSLSNSGMELVLLNKTNVIVDAVEYSPNWHFEIISETKGVSLERISRSALNTSYNWTSAASTVGFATPGLLNSQSREVIQSKSTIELESKSFSPNGDGYQDLLLLKYNIASINTVVNVYVFNENGTLIKQIANNETLSSEGIITWDGEREIGGKANIGIYVILFEHFTPDGKVEKKKLSCILLK